MGYPQFNLTTLQLPAPASNMTKAEYKAAYGIDLDQVNIKAFKLVLLGNEKYPIDKIKAVEDGYEIYFNGRVLSITDIVQTSDEVYDVANAKPIYCHPISIYSASTGMALGCLIFNNSSTPINRNGFKAFLDNLYDVVGETVRIITTGSFIDSADKQSIASWIFKSSSAYGIAGRVGTDGTEGNKSGTFDVVFPESLVFVDGVNKIN